MYSWEANPRRGLDFAKEARKRRSSSVMDPFVVGVVIDLGNCLDLITASGIELVKEAYKSLLEVTTAAGEKLPQNSSDFLRRDLDCAVIRRLHSILELAGAPPIDTVRGLFTEGTPIYPGSGFNAKTHIQIAVCNLACIKGVFRVPPDQF